MTEKNSAPAEPADDQTPYRFEYGHGRMPFFMKLVWVGFLILATWYVVSFLLTAVGEDLGGG